VSYAIQAEGLTKRYGKTIALSGVDLAARQGGVLGLLGPRGAGKTTAVRILGGLLRPDAGHATVGGYDVLRQPGRVRALTGMSGQGAAVDGQLSGFQNLLAVGRLLELSKGDAKQRARELLDRFALSDAGGRPAEMYSAAMRRRLDLAASLVGRPGILFLDEPTIGLDQRGRGELWRLVQEVAAEGVTVLFTTEYLDEADRLATEIAVIDRGLLVASGTPAQLKAKVGGRTLNVRPADPVDLPIVRAVVSSVTGVAPQPTADPGLVSAPAGDPDALPEVMSWLQEAGIAVTEIGLRLAGLDEVFLALTGRRAAAPAPVPAAG
jgi:oleandomycin transport system ATP-binding protein